MKPELALARLRVLWRERCRYGLRRHHPMRVITSARLMETSIPTGSAWAIVSQYHRCRDCGVPLNEVHPEIRPLEGTP